MLDWGKISTATSSQKVRPHGASFYSAIPVHFRATAISETQEAGLRKEGLSYFFEKYLGS